MTVNIELLKKAVNQVVQHPETWCWNRGKEVRPDARSFAEWVQVLAGKSENLGTCVKEATEALGMPPILASWFLDPSRTLSDIYMFSKRVINGEVKMDDYSPSGYDIYGYNRDGYDRTGYNRDGYNRDGYTVTDRTGYNRAGCDLYGYNREGYDRRGYNREGYSALGFNHFGLNKHGEFSNGKKLEMVPL